MKTLFIVRHAKATGKNKGPDDFERTLKSSGRADAEQAGLRLLKTGMLPQFIVSSPAFRAISTARIIAEHIGYPAELIATDMRIFDSGSQRLLKVIGETREAFDSLMIAGHNPGIDDLFKRLSNWSSAEFPKAAVAVLSFDSDSWKELEDGKGNLLHFILPENSI